MTVLFWRTDRSEDNDNDESLFYPTKDIPQTSDCYFLWLYILCFPSAEGPWMMIPVVTTHTPSSRSHECHLYGATTRLRLEGKENSGKPSNNIWQHKWRSSSLFKACHRKCGKVGHISSWSHHRTQDPLFVLLLSGVSMRKLQQNTELLQHHIIDKHVRC